jgi:hypothetical protein
MKLLVVRDKSQELSKCCVNISDCPFFLDVPAVMQLTSHPTADCQTPTEMPTETTTGKRWGDAHS